MARTLITAQVVPAAGVLDSALTFTAVASGSGNGITFDNDGNANKELRVKNAGGASRTLTAIVAQVVDGSLTVTNRTYTIPDGDQITIKNLNPTVYNDGNGRAIFEASGSGLTAALVM